MGLLDRLKALGDPRQGIESIITTQASVLETVRQQHPERDLNAWLALTLAGQTRVWWKTRSLLFQFDGRIFTRLSRKSCQMSWPSRRLDGGVRPQSSCAHSQSI